MPGPVALVGSGEYLPVMAPLEGALIAGRGDRYVQLPTAAAAEGPASVARWVRLGAEQANRLGVEPVAVFALDRASADDPAVARQLQGAGLIYLSGGDPAYLTATLRGTLTWSTILEAWGDGAALAGCSAGAMAMAEWMVDIRRPGVQPAPGLGVVPSLLVLPHFDRLRSWRAEIGETLAADLSRGTVIGIDEETAVVSNGADLSTWRVEGRQSVWTFNGRNTECHQSGDQIRLLTKRSAEVTGATE